MQDKQRIRNYRKEGPRHTTTSVILELEAWHDGLITDEQLSKAAKDWYRKHVTS